MNNLLVAQKKRTPYNYLNDREVITSTTAKKSNKVRVRKLKIICSVLMLFVMGLCFTAGTAVQAIKINKINELKKEIEELKLANERLLLEKAQLQSLDRIEKIATTQLGMQKPKVENLKMLSGDQAEKIQEILFTDKEMVNEKEVKKNESQKDKFSELQPYVAAISSLISSWLITE